jgi:hypothetical protein
VGLSALRLFGHSLARQSLPLLGSEYPHQDTMTPPSYLSRTVMTATNDCWLVYDEKGQDVAKDRDPGREGDIGKRHSSVGLQKHQRHKSLFLFYPFGS